MRTDTRVPLWARILLLALLNGAVLATVFAVFLRSQLKPELESSLMAQARERISKVTTLVSDELQEAPAVEWDSILSRYSNEYGIRLLLYRNTGEQLAGLPTALPPEVDLQLPRGGGPPRQRDNGPPPSRGEPPSEFGGPPRPQRPQGPQGQGGGGPRPSTPGPPFLAVTGSESKYWVGVRMPILDGIGRDGRSVLMLISPSFFTNPFFFDIRPWLLIAAGLAVICTLCWLPLLRNLTHSIAAMTAATARIAEGRFDIQLKATRGDELGRLGASINLMAGRLKTLTEGRKRFLGDVAHELRSPIGRMQLETEILERDSQPASRKYLDDLKEDIALMSRLTDELLQFARADAAPGPVELSSVNLKEAAQAAVQRESTGDAEIRLEIDPTLRVRANGEFLTRSLSNVVRNAIRYAGHRGPIQVSASRKNSNVEISVIDSGPGVPEESLDRIFTPFYRIDDARDRKTGGTGLGLAIVRTCIEASGGRVECRNRRPSGLEVMITLPAA